MFFRSELYPFSTLACRFADYCNTFKMTEINEFICPMLSVDEINTPYPENFTISLNKINKTDTRRCMCVNCKNNRTRCTLQNPAGFCYKYFIKFIRRPTLEPYHLSGCDENTDKK